MRTSSLLLIFIFYFLIPSISSGQGPRVSYYYNHGTELSWANCYVYLKGGSRQRLQFLPVVNLGNYRAPVGTDNYSEDIDIDSSIVFVGNGVVDTNLNSYFGRNLKYVYAELDVTGKIVMFCYDLPDGAESVLSQEFSLETRLSEAMRRGAIGAILFSYDENYPFLAVKFEGANTRHIPAITITKNAAAAILESAGIDGEKLLEDWIHAAKPASMALNTSLKLMIEGKFATIDTDNFKFKFRNDQFSESEREAITETNVKALAFLYGVFGSEKNLKWKKKVTVYFRHFDSKLFYTHHWGFGLASDQGAFNVQAFDTRPSFGLAVHENTHIFTNQNWTERTSSFMHEGIAKYTEALATDPDVNHKVVRGFIANGSIIPLKELIHYNIGMPGEKTIVGYPVSGSFVGFLIDEFSLDTLKSAFILEGRTTDEKEMESTWIRVYSKSLAELEKDWKGWLDRKLAR